MKLIIDVDEKLVCEGFIRTLTEEERNILIRAIGNGVKYVEPKKGEWRRITKKARSIQMWNCSECGRTVEKATALDPDIFFPFCHCGADMRR